MTEYGVMFKKATADGEPGFDPYPYQERIAADGLPEVLRVDTGCGKTEAVILGWLYRRRYLAPETTPRWLVYALPMRTLVEQTVNRVHRWIDNLGLGDEVGVHTVMGGVAQADRRWRLNPEGEAIFIGTIDMLLSRALNRGFADSQWSWPISFGAFNNGCHWVLDEVQLMDAALPTSRQLQALRNSLGTALPTATTWMSATIDAEALHTVDAGPVDTRSVFGLTGSDLAHGALARRVGAERSVRGLGEVHDDKDLAALAVEHHRPGTLTIVVVNTVRRAQAAYAAATKLGVDADVVLLHSRFRPPDRAAAFARLGDELPEAGRIVIATQVIEAGVDLSAATLITDLAPWSSIVQRSGRCNRAGLDAEARLLWVEPKHAAPYDEADIEAARAALDAIDGSATPWSLGATEVPSAPRAVPVLRRRDLIELFDTTPDLSGNVVDVGRFIRDSDDRDLSMLWRSEPDPETDPLPDPAELCSVDLASARKFLAAARHRTAYVLDPVGRRRWRGVSANELRPNQTIMVVAADGGYDPVKGWDPSTRTAVPVVSIQRDAALDDAAAGDDVGTTGFSTAYWLGLADHLADVAAAARDLLGAFGELDMPSGAAAAAIAAGRYHDLGKAHPAFQQALRLTGTDDHPAPPDGAPLAKGGPGRLRHERRYFRHELVSALQLMGSERHLLVPLDEPDLAVFLVAGHHGRVRLGARRLPDERAPDDRAEALVALGVVDGDEVASFDGPDGPTNGGALDLALIGLGPGGPTPSYTARMLALRDRADLGPFRLGFLEMLVRLADWRASAEPGGGR